MATRWADGFEDNAAANLSADYSVTGTWANSTGRRVGTFSIANSSSTTLAKVLGGVESTLFQSVAYKPASLSGVTLRAIMRFQEGAIVHISIALTNSGALAVYRGDPPTTLLGSTTPVMSVGNWYWFQVKVVVHDTTGSVEIRDSSGSVLLNLTGIDTRNAGTGFVDTVVLGVGTSGNTGEYDDWHVWDTTGTICNTWTNDTRIDHRLPIGAGNYAQFTPSSGANYTCVDEANHNTTDYVESAVAGQKDSYAFGDITHSPPTIFSVVRTAVALKDDAGARSLKLLTRRGSTDYAGTAITVNQGAYVRATEIQETDPSTGAAWTQAGYNAAEFGFENV